MSEWDYVLGSDLEESRRLGRQHVVWRPAALAAWRRAGFNTGQRLLDIGCGPGHATLDLADLVGPTGRVIGVDRSTRFLDAARNESQNRGISWLEYRECDLDTDSIPVESADGAWCRWVCCFLNRPADLIRKVGEALRSQGRLVLHEYCDYASWRLAPPSSSFERFVSAVMKSWRDAGGEPDVALQIPAWLETAGFAIDSVRPLVEAVNPTELSWQWPAGYARSALPRLVASGHLSDPEAEAARSELERYEHHAGALMVTPAVLEIVATKA